MKPDPTWRRIGEYVNYVQETDHKFMLNGLSKTCTSYMPFQPAAFISIMWECMGVASGPNFLDVGCGPGTKMAIAGELFGMRSYGIERIPEMADVASAWGDVYTGNALDLYPGMGNMDIIWLYRPFKDIEAERMLEKQIVFQMKSGAILAGGAWEMEPPKDWITVVDDWEIRHGAWKKP
jgi:SAM-dependent methyltransferase